jgi:hypothetical protein
MILDFVELEFRGLKPVEWELVSAIFVSDTDKVKVFFAGAKKRYGYHDEVAHISLAEKSGVEDDDILAGIVVEFFSDNSYRIDSRSGSFWDKIPREEINIYIIQLIEHITKIRSEH